MEKGLRHIEKVWGYDGVEPLEYSSLALAYIGDAAYELVIRSLMILRGNRSVNSMNKQGTEYVKAVSQAKMIRLIDDMLSDEERAVYKRGRNAKSVTTSKHASVIEYRNATGFEALMGYLYIKGDESRMLELIREAIDRMDNNE